MIVNKTVQQSRRCHFHGRIFENIADAGIWTVDGGVKQRCAAHPWRFDGVLTASKVSDEGLVDGRHLGYAQVLNLLRMTYDFPLKCATPLGWNGFAVNCEPQCPGATFPLGPSTVNRLGATSLTLKRR